MNEKALKRIYAFQGFRFKCTSPYSRTISYLLHVYQCL